MRDSSIARRLGLHLLACSLGLAILHQSAHAAPASATDVKELTRISDAWDAAIVRKDRAAIAANMREDFRHIGSDGAVSGKAEFVDGLVAPGLVIEPYTVDEFDVRVYGDVALLSGATRMKGSDDGKPFQVHYRYIDVYVRESGRWRIASVQTTRIKE